MSLFSGFMQQLGAHMMPSNQGFTQTYRCRSVAFHKPDMENGGKSEEIEESMMFKA
jgi:hypothetical protein